MGLKAPGSRPRLTYRYAKKRTRNQKKEKTLSSGVGMDGNRASKKDDPKLRHNEMAVP